MNWGNKYIGFSIAGLSLLAAFAVYCFARIHPPEILIPFSATSIYLSSYTSIFGSAPSFFYTIALGLLVSVCASSQSSAKLHCSIWIGLALFLELSQHPIIAQFVSSWISINSLNWISTLFGPYWSRGVFDPLDLLATLMGGAITMYLIIYLPLDKDNVGDY